MCGREGEKERVERGYREDGRVGEGEKEREREGRRMRKL